MKIFKFHSDLVQDTQAIAASLAVLLKGGEILFFSGPIGVGKTVMVSAIAAAFGFKKSLPSASFAVMRKYKNEKITIYHADLFRLQCGEMFNLGFEDMLRDESGLILVEWPEAAEDFFPQARLEIEFKLKRGDKREIIFKAKSKKYEILLDKLAPAVIARTNGTKQSH